MKRNLQNLLFKIQTMLYQSREFEFDEEDIVYVKVPLKEWRELAELLKELK